MPFDIYSLAQTRQVARDYAVGKLPALALAPPNSRFRVLSDDNAGGAYLNLLFLKWLSGEFLPDTAETEWLDRHADIWIGGRQAGTFATGQATFSGTPGTTVPTGTLLQTGDSLFQTTVDAVIGVLPVNVPIAALNAGVAGNLAAGTALALLNAIAGVDGVATVIALAGGVDAESDASLRERVLFRIQQPPMGGADYDYVRWAREVPGVSRAWCFPQEMGIGTVTVRFMMDDLRADNAGFPTDYDVATVAAYLDGKRPVAVKDFFVAAPIAEPIDFTVSGLVTDDAATHAAIEAAVVAMLADRATPGQAIYRSWIDEAVSGAAGEDRHELAFTTTAMPSPGHLAVLGTVTYA